MTRLVMLTSALLKKAMSSLKEKTLSTPVLQVGLGVGSQAWMREAGLPPPSTTPRMVTESVISSVPPSAVKLPAILGWVSVYVPAAKLILSDPGLLLALRTASRKLQELELSTLLTLLQVLATAPGSGSSKRFTKYVGSGSGISAEGPT